MTLLRLLARVVILAVIIGLVAKLVPGIHTHGSGWWLLWISVIFSIVNAILGPVFKLLSLPLIVLTLGLFLLVVNAALLGITAALSSHLDIDGFGAGRARRVADRDLQLAGRDGLSHQAEVVRGTVRQQAAAAAPRLSRAGRAVSSAAARAAERARRCGTPR